MGEARDAVGVDPGAGELTGVDAIVGMFKEFIEAFPDLTWESAHHHEAGNTAVDEGFVVGTNTGALAMPSGESLPPTSKPMRLRECDIVTVENGVATSHRFYYDQLE